MKNEYIALTGIVILGAVFSLLFGVVNGTIFKTQFSDYADDAESYNRTALNVVERGTFANEDGSYYQFVRRSIGYPLFLAGVYSVWKSPVAVFVAHEILFAIAIVFVWLIARRFLDKYWALLPAFLFALSWFTGAFVVRIGSDLLGMTLGLVFLWAMLCMLDSTDRRWLLMSILSAVALGAMILVRPVMLYFIPLTVVLLLYARWRAAIVFACIAVAVMSPVLVWNYNMFNTFQLASSGYMLAWRTAELEASPARMVASSVAAFAGDLVADQVLSGYADDPDPHIYVTEVFRRRVALKEAGMPDDEIEAMFYAEGLGRVREHPALFLISGIINAVRLHAPPNLDGVSMFHFLVGTKQFSLTVRIALNILVRIVWFALLIVVCWGVYEYVRRMRNSKQEVLFILLFIAYTIGTHALFTNAEFRYLLPIVPIYIIFGSYAVKCILEKLRVPYII